MGIFSMCRRVAAFLMSGVLVAGICFGAVGAGGDKVPLAVERKLPEAEVSRILAAAENAVAAGLPSVGARGFERLLEAEGLGEELRGRVVLELVSARLNEGNVAEASRALRLFKGERGAAYFLREGLVAAGEGFMEDARVSLGRCEEGGLSEADRGWYWFLRGRLADWAGNFEDARAAFGRAEELAVSDWQRSCFVLARVSAQLAGRVLSGEALEELRKNVERSRGRGAGAVFALQYAAALSAAGRGEEALVFLQGELRDVAAADRGAADELRLMVALVGGVGSATGRSAAVGLLMSGRNRDVQRQGLQLLAGFDGGAQGGRELRELLDGLIEGSPEGLLIGDEVLLMRAELALEDNDYAVAERRAQELSERFPGSSLRGAALGVLASVSWELKRYRSAADFASQARQLVGGGDVRAMLGVLVAEAYFRAEDYRSAAGAYGEALKEVPESLGAGWLMAQEVLALVRAGDLEEAGSLLDSFDGDVRFDVANRWLAEWHVSRALQGAGRAEAAFGRVSGLLGRETGALPRELRVRLEWLQVSLSLAAGKPELTLSLAKNLLGALDEISGSFRAEVEARVRLLEARANLRLERVDAALEQLKALRRDFPQSDAAVYSYISEADYYSGKRQFVEAQALLTQLADTFGDNPYAPYALFLAAESAERRGQDEYFREAYRILERINKEYPQSEFAFDARLKQGDLLRRLNQFGPAQEVYSFLINNYPQHPGVLVASLNLAACHRAQAIPPDVSHYESAVAILERLHELPAASVDLRVEAGFQLGDLLAQRPQGAARAEGVWWGMANGFLLDEKMAGRLGERGRYWMARGLLRLGDLLAGQGKLEEARNAYRLVLEKGLPFQNFARESLGRVGG